MSVEKVETSFHLNFEAIELLQKALQTSFFDASLVQVENLLDDYQIQVLEGTPDEPTVQRLHEIYHVLK